jgi:hypothetical protein
MRFTRFALAVSFNLVIGLILIPVSHQVNHKSKTNHKQQLQLADGMPLPPLPPPNINSNSLIADGMPLPPLPPPNADGVTLVADGMPLPPLPPPNVNGTAALA